MEGPHCTLFVPVRESRLNIVSPTIARLPDGTRVSIAYTSLESMHAASGPSQPWIQLGEHALRSMLEPIGVHVIQVDPSLVIADARAHVAVGA